MRRVCARIEKTEERCRSLKVDYKTLGEVNNAISQRIYSLINDTTQKERDRISKDVHDTAGYVFINLIMMLEAASVVIFRDTEKSKKLVNDARNYAEKGINEIRHILQDIRNYTPGVISLQNEFFNIGDSFQKATDVNIDIHYGPWPASFSNNIDSFFISFMQESLTNALKHGHAGIVSVNCWISSEYYGMTVTDNGAGADLPVKKGIGITAMEDVAVELGGNISIKSDTGFRISVFIPIAYDTKTATL
jgi:signal transduction histidine kinase